MKRTIYLCLVMFCALTSCKKNILVSSNHGLKINLNKPHSLDAADSIEYVPSNYKLTKVDNFDGTSLDPNNWFVGCKDPVSGDWIPGAAGQYLLNKSYSGYITAEDSYVQNGTLILQNQKRSYQGTSPAGTYNYTSGWVTSMHRMFMNGA